MTRQAVTLPVVLEFAVDQEMCATKAHPYPKTAIGGRQQRRDVAGQPLAVIRTSNLREAFAVELKESRSARQPQVAVGRLRERVDRRWCAVPGQPLGMMQ